MQKKETIKIRIVKDYVYAKNCYKMHKIVLLEKIQEK